MILCVQCSLKFFPSKHLPKLWPKPANIPPSPKKLLKNLHKQLQKRVSTTSHKALENPLCFLKGAVVGFLKFLMSCDGNFVRKKMTRSLARFLARFSTISIFVGQVFGKVVARFLTICLAAVLGRLLTRIFGKVFDQSFWCQKWSVQFYSHWEIQHTSLPGQKITESNKRQLPMLPPKNMCSLSSWGEVGGACAA